MIIMCDVRDSYDKYLQEAIAIARTFASMKDYHIDGNKEMIALGTMNVAGSFTSCYVSTGTIVDTKNRSYMYT